MGRTAGLTLRRSGTPPRTIWGDDDNATTREIAYVTKDVASVADEDIEFGKSDIKALWESEKQIYELNEPLTEVNYIYVAVEPSPKDRDRKSVV